MKSKTIFETSTDTKSRDERDAFTLNTRDQRALTDSFRAAFGDDTAERS